MYRFNAIKNNFIIVLLLSHFWPGELRRLSARIEQFFNFLFFTLLLFFRITSNANKCLKTALSFSKWRSVIVTLLAVLG